METVALARPWMVVVEFDSETALFGPFGEAGEADAWMETLNHDEYDIISTSIARCWNPNSDQTSELSWKWS